MACKWEPNRRGHKQQLGRQQALGSASGRFRNRGVSSVHSMRPATGPSRCNPNQAHLVDGLASVHSHKPQQVQQKSQAHLVDGVVLVADLLAGQPLLQRLTEVGEKLHAWLG